MPTAPPSTINQELSTVLGSELRSRRMARFASQPFRGTITDYARTITLGSGYLGDWAKENVCRTCRANGIHRCRHFEIDTARHLMGPFAAIMDAHVRVMMLLKAAQTAGSLVWDLSVHFLLVHSPFMRIKVLMDSDEKARAYCTQRLMDTLKNNPDIAPLLPTGSDRFGVTDTELRLRNGKTLFVGGLNDRNASSLPADVMILDEGWLHQADGLMKKAFDRLKQTKTGKIIIVGQAGSVKEDQDDIWQSLHARVPLTWACPCCGERQQFELQKQRPAEFTPKILTTDGHGLTRMTAGQGEIQFPPEPPKPLSYVGFKLPKRMSELNTPEEIKAACAAVTVECYHCGFEIPDTKVMRQRLNDSFEQEYRLRAADGSLYTPPDFTVGFWNPDPASMFVPWRETMEAYVTAFKAKEYGNSVKIRDFYLSRWARAWDEELNRRNPDAGIVVGSYESDPSKLMPNHHSTNMGVDCQKKQDADGSPVAEDVVGSFWYVVREFDKSGNSRQRARGFAESWEELIAVQKFWKVPNQRVVVDSSKWTPQIMMKAAMEFEMLTPAAPHPLTGRKDPYPSCWRLFFGDKRAEFKINGRSSAVSEGQPTPPFHVQRPDGRPLVLRLFKYRWSNFAFEQQLDAILEQTPGMPKFESLPRESLPPKVQAKEVGILTYEQQMGARYVDKVRGVSKYVDIANREAHYRDCELEILARVSQDGLLGHVAGEPPVATVGENRQN